MHCFINPGDHSQNGAAILALPKKLHDKLQLTEDTSISDSKGRRAWGIWIIDGPDYTLLSLFAVIGVLAATVITCIWWGVIGDVQGATGIGQYLLAVMTILSAATLWHLHST